MRSAAAVLDPGSLISPPIDTIFPGTTIRPRPITSALTLQVSNLALGLQELQVTADGDIKAAVDSIKKAVVGAGHAEKAQIRAMVRVLLPRARFDSDDAADALAVAICHVHHRRRATLRILAST